MKGSGQFKGKTWLPYTRIAQYMDLIFSFHPPLTVFFFCVINVRFVWLIFLSFLRTKLAFPFRG